MAERGTLSIKITAGTILLAIALGFLVYLLFYLRDLVLIVLTAIVLASAVEPGVAWFMRYGMHRIFSVASVYLVALGILFGVAYLFFPPLIDETRGYMQTFPQYLSSIN